MKQEEFRPIQGRDEYARYFNQLCEVFRKLSDIFKKKTGKPVVADFQGEMVVHFLSRFLFTIEALRIKCTYNPRCDVKVDLTDSGFPAFHDIDRIQTDLNNQKDRLQALPQAQSLKQALLDHMMVHREASASLLQQLSERRYLEMISEDKLFLPFSPGRFKLLETSEPGRSYVCSWGCYDFSANRPYINIMLFDQDNESEPLEAKDENYQLFMNTLKSEGVRVPALGVMAVGIDQHLHDIHPKIIKRIGIGPICSKHFSQDPADLFELLNRSAEMDNDFVLLFEDETLFSRDQTVSKSLFSRGQVREVFSIPEKDLECFRRKTSAIHKYMLMPHAVAQHLDTTGPHRSYSAYELMTYHPTGGIHVD